MFELSYYRRAIELLVNSALYDLSSADYRRCQTTLDVDVIVEIGSGPDYYRLGESLREIGFTEDASEGTPLCRWLIDGTRVDIMPTDERSLDSATDGTCQLCIPVKIPLGEPGGILRSSDRRNREMGEEICAT